MAAETLVLPLRHRRGAIPHAVIGMTRETGGARAGWLTPSARVEEYFHQFVDIGAGISL